MKWNPFEVQRLAIGPLSNHTNILIIEKQTALSNLNNENIVIVQNQEPIKCETVSNRTSNIMNTNIVSSMIASSIMKSANEQDSDIKHRVTHFNLWKNN